MFGIKHGKVINEFEMEKKMMNNFVIGILCLIFSLFLFFLSPRENKNLLGYKSPQQGLNKSVWKWSNKCFGLLAIIGSVLYLITTIVLIILKLQKYGTLQNKIAIVYIFLCVIITEIYTFVCSYRNR